MPPPPHLKHSCPQIGSDGYWQLADYPTLVFEIIAFQQCNCFIDVIILGESCSI